MRDRAGLRVVRGLGHPAPGAGEPRVACGLRHPAAGGGQLRVRTGPSGHSRPSRRLSGAPRIPDIPLVAAVAPVGAFPVIRPAKPGPLWLPSPVPGLWVRLLIRVGRPAGFACSCWAWAGSGSAGRSRCVLGRDAEPAQRAEPFLGGLAVLAGLGCAFPAAPATARATGPTDGEHGQQRNTAPERSDCHELACACYPVPAMPRRQSHSLTNESIITPQMSNAVPMIVKHKAAGCARPPPNSTSPPTIACGSPRRNRSRNGCRRRMKSPG